MKKQKQSIDKATITDIINCTNEILSVIKEVQLYECEDCIAVDKESPFSSHCRSCYEEAAARAVAYHLKANNGYYINDVADIYEKLLELGTRGAVAISLLHKCCTILYDKDFSPLPRGLRENE